LTSYADVFFRSFFKEFGSGSIIEDPDPKSSGPETPNTAIKNFIRDFSGGITCCDVLQAVRLGEVVEAALRVGVGRHTRRRRGVDTGGGTWGIHGSRGVYGGGGGGVHGSGGVDPLVMCGVVGGGVVVNAAAAAARRWRGCGSIQPLLAPHTHSLENGHSKLGLKILSWWMRSSRG
jgi:hypothetical protein